MTFLNFQIITIIQSLPMLTIMSIMKIQEEVKYLGSVYYNEYQCIVSAINQIDYDPSMHTNDNFKTLCTTNNWRFKCYVCDSHKTRQYSDLSAGET